MPTLRFALALILAGLLSPDAGAQAVLAPWGNLTGLRVGDEPLDFEAGVRLVDRGWSGFHGAVKYLQRPEYSVDGPRRIVKSRVEGIAFGVTLEDAGPGEATLRVQVRANRPFEMEGAYFCLEVAPPGWLPESLELLGADGQVEHRMSVEARTAPAPPTVLRHAVGGVRLLAAGRQLEVRSSRPTTAIVRRDRTDRPTSLNDPAIHQRFIAEPGNGAPAGVQVYFQLLPGSASEGQSAEETFTFRAQAEPDRSPARLVLDTTRPGKPFDGIGGNFRLQFPRTDPAVIRYNLEHLPVAWGRIALPWPAWDPDEAGSPLAEARAGRLDPQVREAFEMARTLGRRRIPVIVSAWTPPPWARAPDQPAGLRGSALDAAKTRRITASLADAVVHLREAFEVEAVLFSFNEPEIGVDVRQTPAEHAAYLKAMGTALTERGLGTRLILGDTAHATPSAFAFLGPALADPSTHPYLGAVAFHTWRGCTPDFLPRWADAARSLGVPLLVTEAGPDAHLHEYPPVLLEPWFQLQEIELYLRVCAFAQPATLMQWQLTTDYSVLQGGGVYGGDGPLRPTQRFWNLAQLGLTPAGAPALPLASDRPEVTGAAFGTPSGRGLAVHVVNRGPRRTGVLAGLPGAVESLQSFVTDATRGRVEGPKVPVRDGEARIVLDAASYTTWLGNVPLATNPPNRPTPP